MTGGGPQEGTGRAILLILYGDKGHSSPCILGEKEDFMFRTGNTDNFNVSQNSLSLIFSNYIFFLNSNLQISTAVGSSRLHVFASLTD